MDDLTPPPEIEDAVQRVLRSNLSDDRKRLLITKLAAEYERESVGFNEAVDRMIAEAEEHLKG